jgi:hypothetical protein
MLYPNAKVSHSSRSLSPPTSHASSRSSHMEVTVRTCLLTHPSGNQKRTKQASAHSPKNAGTSSKQNTPNTAKASCSASLPIPPPPSSATPRTTKSKAHTRGRSVLSLPLPPSNRRSCSRIPPAACFLRGTCPPTRTKLHCARVFLPCLLMLLRLIMSTIPRASTACVSYPFFV